MARIEVLGVRIKREKDVAKYIPYPSEQQFALFLLQEKKQYKVYYERYLYTRQFERDGETVERATRPDFFLVNKKNGHVFHVEHTTSKRGKYRQRQIMMEQGVHYFVFFRRTLERLGERYSRDLVAKGAQRLRAA